MISTPINGRRFTPSGLQQRSDVELRLGEYVGQFG
jgi:hypothetical protein